MAVLIRQAVAEDAAALARIGAALFEQTYADAIPPAEIAAHVAADFGEELQRRELSAPDVLSLVVEEDGEPVGFAQIRERPLPVAAEEPADIELWRIYLDRKLHGRGVARELLKEIGAFARDRGARGVWLAVWEDNPRAIAFYEKHGFMPVGRQDFRVGDELQSDLVLRASPDAF